MNQKEIAVPPVFGSRFSQIPDCVKTIVLLAAATAAAWIINTVSHSPWNISVIYILAVVIVSSLTTRYRWGVIASAAGVTGANFFFTYPYFELDFSVYGYPLTFATMLTAALITTTLTNRIKAQVRLSLRREVRTQKLYEITKKLLATRGLENIIAQSHDFLKTEFGCDAAFYLDDPDDDIGEVLLPVLHAPPLTGEDQLAAEFSFFNHVASGAGAGTNSHATRFYLPITSPANSYGAVGLVDEDGSMPADGDMAFLEMMISQIAMALERQRLSDDQRKISIEAEKEKMRSTLLRAISHDLRTPLTGILGASSAIMENHGKLTLETHDKLIHDIREDSQWLIRMVENLLSVTRMKDGETRVTKSPEAVEEIVSEAISRIRTRFPGRKIQIKVPDELLMVPMDGTLIEQVLINLVENAIKHSAENPVIELTVRSETTMAVFEISDNGDGINPEELPHLFDGYIDRPNISSDSSRGIGIGLSICNSIIKAHGGSICAENKPDGGARFTFRLPL